MQLLIKGADVFAPVALGRKDILDFQWQNSGH